MIALHQVKDLIFHKTGLSFVLRWLFKGIKRFALIIGFLALLIVGFQLLIAPFFDKYRRLPKAMVVHLDLEGEVRERGPLSLRAYLDKEKPFVLFYKLLFILDQIKTDGRVKGVLIRLGHFSIGRGQREELARAIQKVREAGKVVWISATHWSMGHYPFLSAADKLFLESGGHCDFKTLGLEMPLYRNLFDILGIVPQFIYREEYKSAHESFTQHKLSPKNREQYQILLEGIEQQAIQMIAQNRKKEPQDIEKRLHQGSLTSEEALEGQWIDGIGSFFQVRQMLKAELKLPSGRHVIPSAIYYEDRIKHEAKKKKAKQPGLGVLILEGDITVGKILNPALHSENIQATVIQRVIEKLRKKPHIRGLVVRINSRGGCALGSEMIFQALRRFGHETGLPIVVSMGDCAASGGYFIAAAGHKIFANASTLTGSIGVYTGKFVVSKATQKVTVDHDQIVLGENALIESPFQLWDGSNLKKMESEIDKTYGRFLSLMSQARNKPIDEMREVAKGRVWLGEAAQKCKLVDHIGGLQEAIQAAREMAGLTSKAPLYYSPESKGLLGLFLQSLSHKKDAGGFEEPFSQLKAVFRNMLVSVIQSILDNPAMLISQKSSMQFNDAPESAVPMHGVCHHQKSQFDDI